MNQFDPSASGRKRLLPLVHNLNKTPISVMQRQALLVVGVCLVLLLAGWGQAVQWYKDRLLSDHRAAVTHEIAPYSNALSAAVNRRFALLNGLWTFVHADLPEPAITEFEFNLFASGLYTNANGIRNFSIAPNGVQQYVYPLEGNEGVVGHDLMTDERPDVRADVQRALTTREIALSGPYELRQGGLGLVARRAVYHDGTFWGLVAMVIDAEPIFTEAGLLTPTSMEFALRQETGPVFFGRETLFQNNPILYQIDLPEGRWMLAAVPNGGWNASITGNLTIFRLSGLAIVGLLGIVVYLMVNRQIHLTSMVHARTQALAETNQKLRDEISERQRTEIALRTSEELWRSLTESSPDHILTLDTDLNIQFANYASPGLTIEDLTGTPLHTHAKPERQAEIKAILTDVLRSGQPASYETIYDTPNNDRIYYESRVVPRIEGGNVIGLTVSARDVTQRKQAEEFLMRHREHLEELVTERTTELQTANEQLKALSEVKDEFVANVSHELRTPITSLVLREYLLERQPDQVHRHLPVLQRETARLQHTIEALLNLSRLDQNHMELLPTSVNLNDLIDQYVIDRTAIIQQQGLTLTTSQHPDLPLITADPNLLGQVLSILLTNAINYTPTGGTITIKSRRQLLDGGDWVGFCVSDTGLGIPSSDLPNLFERFFRGKAGRESGKPGTGLGLSIAKEIVERHQGRIEVESSGVRGQGATFSIWLPVNSAAGEADS